MDAVSGQPVPHALVKLSAASPRATLADSEGKFQFEGLPAGRVTLASEKPGFLSRDPSGTWSMPSLEVQLAPDSRPALLKLLPEGVISGQLSDENGEPLEGFTVSVIFHNRRGSRLQRVEHNRAITDDEGKFRIPGLFPGYTYYLEARQAQPPLLNAIAKSAAPAGYRPVFYPGVSDIASATPLKALAGRTVQANLSLKREQFIQLSGTVSGYAPQEQVSLMLWGSSATPQNSEICFDAHAGSFHTKWISPGIYTLTAQSSVIVDRSAALSVALQSPVVVGLAREATASYATLRVNATSSLGGLHLTLQPTIDIPVVVRGLPPTGPEKEETWKIYMQLFSKDGLFSRSDVSADLDNPKETNTSGTVHMMFLELAQGAYSLSIESNPVGAFYTESATWGSIDLLRNDLVLDTSGSVPPIEVVLRDDGATLNGKVLSGDTPLPTQVVLLSDTGRKPISAPVSADGTFAVFGLAPGVYRVFAVDTSADFDYGDPAFPSKISSKIQEITLAPKQSASINLELAAVGE